MRRYVVTRKVDHVHVVSVGVEADNCEEAEESVRDAIDYVLDGNPPSNMALLRDDYWEADDAKESWDVEGVGASEWLKVDGWKPDQSVQLDRARRFAIKACRLLLADEIELAAKAAHEAVKLVDMTEGVEL